MKEKVGNVTIPPDVGIRPHELCTARSLAKAGHEVVFLKKSDVEHRKTPDILMDGVPWEMKAPIAPNARALDRNVRRALRQSSRIVIDARRIKKLPDSVVERELRKYAREMQSIKAMLMIDHHENIIDIK